VSGMTVMDEIFCPSYVSKNIGCKSDCKKQELKTYGLS
jgi:hypothetical protein